MKNNNSALTYNLKAVVLETGLKPVTLRAWERRYGLPQPQRTEGGHRLYTERDIEIIKWLIARQEEGISIRQAVTMWRKLSEREEDPLDSPSFSNNQETQPVTIISPNVGEQLASLRQQWIDACLVFDEVSAERALLNAFSIFPAEVICLEILQKAISEIGMLWYEGKVTVQQEHFASALATRRLEMLISGTPPPTRPERIVIGCAPQDAHTFGPLVLAFLLRRCGWDTIYLGANVPGENLEGVLAKVKPNLVILSAQLLHTAANLMEVAYSLKPEGVLVGYGGLIFNSLPELRNYIPGHFLGQTVVEASQKVHTLFTTSAPPPPVKKASETYIRALSNFQEKRGLIETAVWDTLVATEMSTSILTNANENMAHTIIAALKLGNIHFLGNEISWVKGLLRGYHMPIESLQSYLMTYYHAAKTHLDDPGQIVMSWLAEVVIEEKDL